MNGHLMWRYNQIVRNNKYNLEGKFKNYRGALLVAQLVKNLPAVQETWVLAQGWEDSLEKGKATHSSMLAWRTSWSV